MAFRKLGLETANWCDDRCNCARVLLHLFFFKCLFESDLSFITAAKKS